MKNILQCILLGILMQLTLCGAQRYPKYYDSRPQRPYQYNAPARPLPRDYFYDDYYEDGWTSPSGFHSSRPPREPYYIDDYDYDYDYRPPPRPQRPSSNGRPNRPNSNKPSKQEPMTMNDMLKEAEKYSGQTRGLADIVDQMGGTYEDKILPSFGGGSASDGFDYKGLSGQIRQGAEMMDSASALIKKITSTFGSN